MLHSPSFQIIEQVKWKEKNEYEEPDYKACLIFVKRNLIDFNSLPKREATIEERRKMMGSIGTMYEMKLPVVYCPELRKYFLVHYFKKVLVVFDDEVELVMLQAPRLLPSVFRKERKPKQIWR